MVLGSPYKMDLQDHDSRQVLNFVPKFFENPVFSNNTRRIQAKSSTEAELVAIEMGVQMAMAKGYVSFIGEGDSYGAVNKVKKSCNEQEEHVDRGLRSIFQYVMVRTYVS